MNRILRHNLDAEASVLGGVIMRNEVLADLDTLEPGHFYDPRHYVVFEAMRNLEAARKPIDVVMLETEIERSGKLGVIGSIAFLGELALRVPTADNVRSYAEIVQEHATTRRLAIVASEIVERAYDPDADAQELLGDAMNALAKLDRAKPDSAVTIGTLAQRRVRELEQLMAARERGERRITGVPTGIASLDRKIGGYQYGIVNLIAARPAMGKTGAAMACVDAATHAGYAAHVFSQEDGWRAYTDRSLSRRSGIAVEKLRQGDLTSDDAAKLGAAMINLGQRKNWLVDERSGLSADEIVRSVRRWLPKLHTKLVVVDYVQILRRSPRLDENAAIYEIMTTFAHAAKADDIAYVVLSQLNRDVEKRVDKRPQMSDLRGSGALEEQSKIIVSPYRGAYYSDKPKRHVDYDCTCESPSTISDCTCAPSIETFERTVQMLILKNNQGERGRVFAGWRAETVEMW
jgi:replicative DNA helicase